MAPADDLEVIAGAPRDELVARAGEDVAHGDVLQQIRASDTYTPTLFLTARDSVIDRVTGLTAGGDDYMTKPFSLEELVAR